MQFLERNCCGGLCHENQNHSHIIIQGVKLSNGSYELVFIHDDQVPIRLVYCAVCETDGILIRYLDDHITSKYHKLKISGVYVTSVESYKKYVEKTLNSNRSFEYRVEKDDDEIDIIGSKGLISSHQGHAFYCCICTQTYCEEAILIHLESIEHTEKFIAELFPVVFEKILQTAEYRNNKNDLFNKIRRNYMAIFGIGEPLSWDSNTFPSSTYINIIDDVLRSFHKQQELGELLLKDIVLTIIPPAPLGLDWPLNSNDDADTLDVVPIPPPLRDMIWPNADNQNNFNYINHQAIHEKIQNELAVLERLTDCRRCQQLLVEMNRPVDRAYLYHDIYNHVDNHESYKDLPLISRVIRTLKGLMFY